MFTLDIKYSDYLCLTSLLLNHHLSDIYHNTVHDNPNNQLDFNYYDYDLEQFLIELIEKDWMDIEDTDNTTSMLFNYVRLSDLIQYIYQINCLHHKYEQVLEETFYRHPTLSDCQLADSRLIDFQVDNRNHRCVLNLSKVLLYDEMRKNKSIPVDNSDITIIFSNTQKVKIKGELYAKDYEANKVYSWHIMKTSENVLCFCLLVLFVHKCFMIEILCNDIEVKLLND